MPTEPIIEHYSYSDYRQWQGDWELIKGIPQAMTPSPTIIHQSVAAEILHQLMSSIGDCEDCLVLPEQDWKISDDTVVRPDVTLVCNEPNEEHITRAPEIIVEVVSPATARRDEVVKYQLYEQEGVKYYILVYPAEPKARLYHLRDGVYVRQGDYINEACHFDDAACQAEIDFDKVFRCLRER